MPVGGTVAVAAVAAARLSLGRRLWPVLLVLFVLYLLCAMAGAAAAAAYIEWTLLMALPSLCARRSLMMVAATVVFVCAPVVAAGSAVRLYDAVCGAALSVCVAAVDCHSLYGGVPHPSSNTKGEPPMSSCVKSLRVSHPILIQVCVRPPRQRPLLNSCPGRPGVRPPSISSTVPTISSITLVSTSESCPPQLHTQQSYGCILHKGESPPLNI